MNKPRNIVLVGFMGTGKSAVARELAGRLGWAAVDTDALVEQAAGASVGEIFDRQGEPAFRKLESDVIEKLSHQGGSSVIATGGGAVLQDRNWTALRRLGPVVALTALTDTILERTQKGRTRRPLLEVKDPRAEIEARLGARAAHYAKADHQVATDGKTPKEVGREILDLLGLSG